MENDKHINLLIENVNEEKIKVSIVHKICKEWKKIIMLLVASFLFAFGTIIFLTQANTIPSGVSSISQTLFYFFVEIKPYITLIYFGLNVPLILFFWNKVKKSFIIWSIVFMLLNSFWGFILGEYGKPINDLFVVIKGWNIDDYINSKPEDNYSTWPIFVYTSLAIFTNSIGATIAWKCGASTGGTDIVAFYFSTKKKINVGRFLSIIAIVISFFSVIALYFGHKYDSLFGIRTICSLYYILMSSFFINLLYPKYKKIVMRVDSKKYEKLVDYFRESKYCHAFKIVESTSGYTGQKNYTIETVMLLLEYKEIKNQLIKIDPNVWITKSLINDQLGNFNYSKLEK